MAENWRSDKLEKLDPTIERGLSLPFRYLNQRFAVAPGASIRVIFVEPVDDALLKALEAYRRPEVITLAVDAVSLNPLAYDRSMRRPTKVNRLAQRFR